MTDIDLGSGWRDRLAMERRDVLKVLGGALLAGTVPLSRAVAADGEIVLQNWGGAAEKAVMAAFSDPTKTVTGRTLVVDGSGSMVGKVKAMVEAKHVTVDIMDLPLGDGAQIGQQGLLEDIDYSIVDKSKVPPGMTTQWGVASYFFSYIFAVNEKRAKDKIPKTWADFWNVKDFPGKRGLPGYSQGVYEAALLADGVAPDKLYPLDLDRAEREDQGDQARTRCSGNPARRARICCGRARSWPASCGGNRAMPSCVRNMKTITWGWDDADPRRRRPGACPRAIRPAVKAAMEFINLALDPAGQAKVFEIVGMSPTNFAANALIPAEEQPFNAAAHTEHQVKLSDDWWAKHADEAESRYVQAISS